MIFLKHPISKQLLDFRAAPGTPRYTMDQVDAWHGYPSDVERLRRWYGVEFVPEVITGIGGAGARGRPPTASPSTEG